MARKSMAGEARTAGDAGGIPEPPWRRAPRRRPGRRTPLSRDAIVDAALRLLDRDGLSGLSMRQLAEELGTGAASLYWHVGSKEELLDVLYDRVMAQIPVPEPDAARWREQVKEAMRTTRRVLASHRDLARVAIGRIPLGPNALVRIEGLLAILRAGGVPPQAAAFAGDMLGLFVVAFALEDGMGLLSPSADGASEEQVVGMMRDYFASLPAERFPNVVALAAQMTAGDRDERFEFGLDLLVRGLAAHAN